MLYCPNFFWNVLQVWMTGKDVYLQMTWSWPDKTWNILCSYRLQWNTSQSKFRNHYFLFLFAFSILSQLFLIWGCKSDQYLCKILLVACKKTITKNWLKDSTLNCKQWFEIIEQILVMEELTYTLNMKKSAFRMDWEKWLIYKEYKDILSILK